ncbi:MAG: hypothetical protein ACP5E3_05780 [Bacteroidales bacterium]
MNRIKLLLTGSLFAALICSGLLYGQENEKYYRRAPDVLPGTLPEMRTSDFWIDKSTDPDKVILNQDAIERMNQEYRSRMKDLTSLEHDLGAAIEKEVQRWSGLLLFPAEVSGLPHNELVKTVKDMVDSQVKMLRGKEHGNILGIEYADWEINALESELNIEKISEIREIQQGITVRDCRIRVIPTLRPEHVAIGDNRRARWDMFNLDIVPIASPVIILHTSKSSGFLLVISSRGYGWIRSENIAFPENDQSDNLYLQEDFLVCTGEQVPFYSSPECKLVSGWLRMGDKIKYSIRDGQFTVDVPRRKTDGSLVIERAWLKKDADVNRGFLPYTRRNIINQAFKLLDLVYDYTGAWYGRNHVTILRDLFACFGFELPNNGVLLKAYNPAGIISPEKGKEEQYRAIMENEPFITIQISGGHSQLYLGTHERTPFVFDTHGYGYTGDDGNEYIIRRSCIYTPEIPAYMLKNDLFFVKLK